MKRPNKKWCSYDYMIRVGAVAFCIGCVLVTLVAAFYALRSDTAYAEVEIVPVVACEVEETVCEVEEEPKIEETYEETVVVEETATESLNTEGLICLGEFRVTAYCSCEKCCGIWAQNRPTDENGNEIIYTASGAVAQEGVTIAVDPSVIPFGTRVVIDGNTYIAQDTGGAINGNCADIYFANHEAACAWGLQKHDVFLAEVLK